METQFPEGAIIPFALHQERERLLNEPTPVPKGKTLKFVIRHYVSSTKYQELAQRTAQDYDKHLDYLRKKMGHLHPRHIERRHVILWLDEWAKKETPHRANYRLRVLRLLLEHAIDMGLIGVGQNPAKGVSELKYDKQERQPWPDTKIAAFRKVYPPGSRERTLFELLLGTGQRIGDVLKMQWGHIEDGGVSLRQNKTNKVLWIPLTRHLQEALAAAPQRNITILTNHSGKGPWSYRGASDAMMKARILIRATDYDLHSLRYSAASELLIAGCTDELIASVTGQSARMVEHYTRQVRQKVRAKEAQSKRK